MGSNLTKTKLDADLTTLANGDNVGSVIATADGVYLTHTTDGAKEALDVHVSNTSIEVTATNLDIRDLAFATDSVTAHQGGTWTIDSITNPVTVTATNLDIRDLTSATDSVTAVVDYSFAEDSAHASGDKGAFILAVRNDTPGSLTSADGDYAPLQVDANGALRVSGSFSVNPADNHLEDSPAASGDTGSFILGVRQDTLATSTSADGDYNAIKTDSRGATWVAPVGTAADDAVDTEAPVKTGTRSVSGAALGAVSADGDRADMISDKYRRLYINDSPNVAILSSAKTITTSATAVVTTALAGRRRIQIQNGNTSDIYIGASGVTTANGLLVPKNATESLDIGENVAIFAIVASGTASIRVLEIA